MLEVMCLIHEETFAAQNTWYTVKLEVFPVTGMLDMLVELEYWHGCIKALSTDRPSECRVSFLANNLCGSEVLKIVVGRMLVIDGAFQEGLVLCHVRSRRLGAESRVRFLARVGGISDVSGVRGVSGVGDVTGVALRLHVLFDIAVVLVVQFRVGGFGRLKECCELVFRE